METYNLKLKDDVNPEVLKNYGFSPKYDYNTGEIIEYRIEFSPQRECRIEIDKKKFSFVVHMEQTKKWFRTIETKGWMALYDWSSAVSSECMKLLYRLIKDNIVEPI